MVNLERMWKEAVVTQLRSYHGVCLGGLRKTAIRFIQDSWCPSQNSDGHHLCMSA
jgi:hypothetical protein